MAEYTAKQLEKEQLLEKKRVEILNDSFKYVVK
jgi:hypothetical protein